MWKLDKCEAAIAPECTNRMLKFKNFCRSDPDPRHWGLHPRHPGKGGEERGGEEREVKETEEAGSTPQLCSDTPRSEILHKSLTTTTTSTTTTTTNTPGGLAFIGDPVFIGKFYGRGREMKQPVPGKQGVTICVAVSTLQPRLSAAKYATSAEQYTHMVSCVPRSLVTATAGQMRTDFSCKNVGPITTYVAVHIL